MAEQTALKCQHARKEPRQRTQRDGRVVVVEQCLTCGSPLGNIRKADIAPRAVESLPVYDERLRDIYEQEHREIMEAHWTRFRGERRAAAQQEADDRYETWWRWYQDYRQSGAWQDKRAMVMNRAMGICEGCGTARATQVHHLTYEHCGHEMLWELRAVCDECHDVCTSEVSRERWSRMEAKYGRQMGRRPSPSSER